MIRLIEKKVVKESSYKDLLAALSKKIGKKVIFAEQKANGVFSVDTEDGGTEIIEYNENEIYEASKVSQQSSFKFPLDVWFYKYKDEIKGLIESNDPILNTFCIVAIGGHQYAMGVTGVNRYQNAYINKETQQGYRLKSEAASAAKTNDIKSFHKKGKGDQGYGDVGSSWNTVSIITIKEFFENYEKSKKAYALPFPSYFEGI